jgi:hypothetical protein
MMEKKGQVEKKKEVIPARRKCSPKRKTKFLQTRD